MSQQLVNVSLYVGDITVTIRMTDRYAVVNPPEPGKHRKTQAQRESRHANNELNPLIERINPRKKAAPR